MLTAAKAIQAKFYPLTDSQILIRESQMLKWMGRTFAKCLDTPRKKNADYAGTGDDYANSEGIGVSCQYGILMRLQDRFIRLENLMTAEAQVSDESIEDTIDDAILKNCA
jgi:hypothetical protein